MDLTKDRTKEHGRKVMLTFVDNIQLKHRGTKKGIQVQSSISGRKTKVPHAPGHNY